MPDPITIGAAATSLLGGAYRGIQGIRQQRDARRALEGLEGQEPDIYVPSSIRQRAIEPISQQLLTAEQEAAARRTAESVGALQKAGARGIIGGVNRVMDSERADQRARTARNEQERRSALGALGAAEMDVQGRKMTNYLQKIQAAQRALEAGQQNVAGALDVPSQLGQQYLGAQFSGLLPENMKYKTNSNSSSTSTKSPFTPTQIKLIQNGMLSLG